MVTARLYAWRDLLEGICIIVSTSLHFDRSVSLLMISPAWKLLILPSFVHTCILVDTQCLYCQLCLRTRNELDQSLYDWKVRIMSRDHMNITKKMSSYISYVIQYSLLYSSSMQARCTSYHPTLRNAPLYALIAHDWLWALTVNNWNIVFEKCPSCYSSWASDLLCLPSRILNPETSWVFFFRVGGYTIILCPVSWSWSC